MPENTSSGLKYEILCQHHPEYDGKRYASIEDLYVGGWTMMRKAREYLAQLPMEHPTLYASRCNTTAYVPYFGQIVDQFVSDLFTQPLSVNPAGDAKSPDTPGEFPDPEFYTSFAKDADGEGNGVEDLAGDLLTTALKHRCSFLMVDAPVVDGPAPTNLAEEEALGARKCYAYEVSPDQVIDWKMRVDAGPDGKKTSCFDWVILYCKEQERESPASTRTTVTESFTVWSLAGEGADVRAQWDKYEVTYTPGQNDPRPEDVIPHVDGGLTSFDRIPLLIFELPAGLHVGNKIGPMALEHWIRRSELVGAEKRSCVSIPYVAQGPEIPAIGESGSEAQEDPDRGEDPVTKFHKQGFLKLGHQDKFEFAEPHGHAYEVLDKQIDHVRESMYAVNHQMAASVRPNSTALGRSGLSKQKDQDKTDKVLGALGRLVRGFFTRVYDTLSKARGEDVVWVASGLDNYETYDRQAVIQESIGLSQVAVPSPTFRKEHAKRVATALVPGLPPQTVAQISEEIDQGVDSEEEKRQLQLEADKELIKNPPDPGTPGAGGGGPPVGASKGSGDDE